MVSCAVAHAISEREIENLEEEITLSVEAYEQAKSGSPHPSATNWTLRSKHLVFGMPKVVDQRHDFTPSNDQIERTGVSVMVRQAYVVAHFDRMRAPLFVSQRWTTADYLRMNQLDSLGRPWKVDYELPEYARTDTSYDGNRTKMDRGHMARHAKNRAWGVDASEEGCLMSNSAPQHISVNRGAAWRSLEDELRDICKDVDSAIPAIWVISGTLYRDKENPANELPEDDFEDVVRVGDEFGVPDATYKIVGWFDLYGKFQARGYVFEEKVTSDQMEDYLTPIDEIEQRAGVDFFPELADHIENQIESTSYAAMWN